MNFILYTFVNIWVMLNEETVGFQEGFNEMPKEYKLKN